MMGLTVIILLLIALAPLVWLVYRIVWGTPPSFNLAVERLTWKRLHADPETVARLGLLENPLLKFHCNKLTDASPRFMARQRQLDREGLALIRRYNPATLTEQERLTYDLVRWHLEQNLRGHRFDYHWEASRGFRGPYPVNPVFGVQRDLICFLSNDHNIRGRRSAHGYLQRLKEIPEKLKGLEESLAVRKSQGVIAPRSVLEESLAQIETFLSVSLEKNPLYLSFMEKAAESDRFSEAARMRWGLRVEKTLEVDVLPAYRRLKNALLKLSEQATDDDGIWKLLDGGEYYAFLLRHFTTTDLTAKAIHQLGLEEVARLTESIRTVLIALNLPSDRPGEQLRALREDRRFYYSGDYPHQAIIEDYQKVLDEVNQRMPEIFSQGMLKGMIVRRLPEYQKSDAPIAFGEAPSWDGSQPATLWVNLGERDDLCRWCMRTLAYHEGIPGHAYRRAQLQKNRNLPLFRRLDRLMAYEAGWALYAVQLAWEINPGDAFDNLGRLQAQLRQAVRLVVDTGFHDRGWTRARALTYMMEMTGLSERVVHADLMRAIVMPGEACAGTLGYLKLMSMRQKAAATLGDQFNLKDFHDVILNQGSLPLPMLESLVNEFIDRTAGLKSPDS